jgi:hypothetical protein
MEKVQKADFSITVEVIDGQQIIEIDLGSMLILDWTLNLCLLRRGLIESITYHTAKGSNLKVRIDTGLKVADRATVGIAPDNVYLAITATELDYWESFFLKYYRDGVAEVDHLDIEAQVNPPSKNCGYVILKVAKVKPPMTPEEVRKMLGL